MHYKIGDRVPMPPDTRRRSVREAIPNGDSFKSKNYTAHLIGDKPVSGRMPTSYYNRIGMEHPCPVCEKPVGEMCVSVSKTRKSNELTMVHRPRLPRATRKTA